MKNRKDLQGTAGISIDYMSTVQMMRSRKTKKKDRETEPMQSAQMDEPGGGQTQDRHQLNPKQRGYMRSILGGAVLTGERLITAGLRQTALCPFCLTGETEDIKHLWQCPATEERREKVRKHTRRTRQPTRSNQVLRNHPGRPGTG